MNNKMDNKNTERQFYEADIQAIDFDKPEWSWGHSPNGSYIYHYDPEDGVITTYVLPEFMRHIIEHVKNVAVDGLRMHIRSLDHEREKLLKCTAEENYDVS